jgi:hypothetical protein
MLKLRGVGPRATVSLREQIHNYYRAQNLSTLVSTFASAPGTNVTIRLAVDKRAVRKCNRPGSRDCLVV